MPEIELDRLEDLLSPPSKQEVPEAFPVVSAPISYSDFFRKYLARNVPCLVKKGAIEHWESRREWTSPDGTTACLSGLSSMVPDDLVVPVTDCGKRYFNSHECSEMRFSAYRQYWEGQREKDGKLLYLKDWHFHRDVEDHGAYQTPEWFCSDWLNEYWEREDEQEDSSKERNDYRFVYVGPKGSWTPFHADVFGSFSWSANVAGRKRWVLFPPGHEGAFKDPLNNLAHDVDQHTTANKDAKAVPKKYEVIQESGDVMFVPSMWHHQVHNLKDAISVNHNWFNGANAPSVWRELCIQRKAVKREVRDCRATCSKEEWLEMCEKLLRVNHGMNVADFADLLAFVGLRRKRILEGDDGEMASKCALDDASLGKRHADYDLQRVKETLRQMRQDLQGEDEEPSTLVEKVRKALAKLKHSEK